MYVQRYSSCFSTCFIHRLYDIDGRNDVEFSGYWVNADCAKQVDDVQ